MMETEIKCTLKTVSSHSNCTSLPDCLDQINLGDGTQTPSSPTQSPLNFIVNNNNNNNSNISNGLVSNKKIPSIIINSSNNDDITQISELPYKNPLNKRCSSLLVRFNQNNAGKLSKREQIKLKILENKAAADAAKSPNGGVAVVANGVEKNKREEADSGLCSANEETIDVKNSEQCEDVEAQHENSKDVKLSERQQLIRSLTRPFTTIRRQTNRTTKSEKSHQSPKPHGGLKSDDDAAHNNTPIKQSNSLRQKNIHFEMPLLSEETNLSSLPNETTKVNNKCESKQNLVNAISTSNISMTQNSEPSNPPKSPNFFFEYLLNNSKANNTNNNANNAKMEISKIAALAAMCDLKENGEASNGNDAASNEMALKNFLMDLVTPPLVPTSQFDLSSAGSSMEHLELQFNYQLNENSAQNGYLNNKQQVDTGSFNVNFNSSMNGVNNKKQVNEQIRRACMGYLDYINKKHNRERRIQFIRNKVSGFVLLTIVFLLILGLALIMTFVLGRALTKMFKKSSTLSFTYNATSSPFSGDYLVPTILQSEHMVTAMKNNDNDNNNNNPNINNKNTPTLVLLSDEQACEIIKKNLSRNFKELAKRTNISRAGLDKLVRQLNVKFFNSTIIEILASRETSNQVDIDAIKSTQTIEEDTEYHYIEYVFD